LNAVAIDFSSIIDITVPIPLTFIPAREMLDCINEPRSLSLKWSPNPLVASHTWKLKDAVHVVQENREKTQLFKLFAQKTAYMQP